MQVQKRENIFNKARNCNGTGTPIANCNLLVGDSPQAVGFSPVGHLPVGQSPVGHNFTDTTSFRTQWTWYIFWSWNNHDYLETWSKHWFFLRRVQQLSTMLSILSQHMTMWHRFPKSENCKCNETSAFHFCQRNRLKLNRTSFNQFT